MRRVSPCLMVLGFLASTAVAQEKTPDKEAPVSPELQALVKDYESATRKFSMELRHAYETAKRSGEQATFDFKKEHPGGTYSKRFLALAEKDPESPTGFQAIRMALNTSGGPDGKAGTWAGSIKLLRDHYAAKPGIKKMISMVGGFGDETGDGFVRDVIAKNPDRELQAKAYQSLAEAREEIAETAKMLKENEELRKRLEKTRGKEIDKLMARGDSARKEAEALRNTLREKYADLVADLAIGRPMPELTSEDLEGKTVKLSDLKGKVVVIDIWATWCGPCRAMIPHEREMVERFKDKPFALVSVSADEEKKTLTDFLAREKMPWTHWWSGPEGKLMDTLNIQHFPTIFVLDAEGVIRHKEVRNEGLEKAVEGLLKELEEKKTAAK